MVQAIIVIIGVTLIAYLLIYLLNEELPDGIAHTILGARATPPAVALFNRQHHLYDSFWVQWWDFVKQLLHGNFGYSYQYNRTTDSLFAIDLPRDLVLGGISLILSLMIAIPLGIAQAVKRNQAVDYIGTGIGFTLYSMPPYAVAIILIQIFAISTHLFSAEGPQGALFGQPSALVLPILSLTLINYAYFSRYMRSSAIDTLAQDYIRTARAKGLSERAVLMRHLVRNSLLTVITLIGLSIPVIITGNLIIEDVFNYPGIGLEYVTAALNNDFEVMLGITVLVGILTVLGNLLADVAYALLDPRVRY